MITLLTLLFACGDKEDDTTEEWIDGDWFDKGVYEGELELQETSIEILSSGRKIDMIYRTSFYLRDSSTYFENPNMCEQHDLSLELEEVEITLECTIGEILTEDTWEFTCVTVTSLCSGNGYYHREFNPEHSTCSDNEDEYTTLGWNNSRCPLTMDLSGSGFKDGFYISGDGSYAFNDTLRTFDTDFNFYFGN